MPRKPIPTWNFALVVVRKADKFLIVQEAKHGQQWYLPAGRVEPGESFEQAAVRETMEEAGLEVRPSGILRIEHSPLRDFSRMRVIFLAHPVDDRPPKSEADAESLRAEWTTLEDLANYSLRGNEVQELFQFVADGAPVYPSHLITEEGDPFS